jgi:hypothetical protein
MSLDLVGLTRFGRRRSDEEHGIFAKKRRVDLCHPVVGHNRTGNAPRVFELTVELGLDRR